VSARRAWWVALPEGVAFKAAHPPVSFGPPSDVRLGPMWPTRPVSAKPAKCSLASLRRVPILTACAFLQSSRWHLPGWPTAPCPPGLAVRHACRCRPSQRPPVSNTIMWPEWTWARTRNPRLRNRIRVQPAAWCTCPSAQPVSSCRRRWCSRQPESTYFPILPLDRPMRCGMHALSPWRRLPGLSDRFS